jgi:histidinol-phosphate aminotransferase
MVENLRGLGVPQWPTQANFILVKIGPLHAEFVQAMHRRGVLTRDRSKDQGCNGCVRLTVGTRAQMKQAVEAMAESLNEIGWEKA